MLRMLTKCDIFWYSTLYGLEMLSESIDDHFCKVGQINGLIPWQGFGPPMVLPQIPSLSWGQGSNLDPYAYVSLMVQP